MHFLYFASRYNIYYYVAFSFGRWMCKSCKPLSMGETDTYFRNYIKNITYGRCSPPIANTALSELVNLYAEIELKVRKIIDDYQTEGLLVSISTYIWGEDGALFAGLVVLLLLFHCSLYLARFVIQEQLFWLCLRI